MYKCIIHSPACKPVHQLFSFQSTHPPDCPSITDVRHFTSLPAHPLVSLSIHQLTHLSIHLSIYPPVYPFACTSCHLPTRSLTFPGARPSIHKLVPSFKPCISSLVHSSARRLTCLATHPSHPYKHQPASLPVHTPAHAPARMLVPFIHWL